MLLVALTAISHERWLVCIFILSEDMFTQTRAGRSDIPLICLIQASSGSGALQLQAAVASCFLANTATQQWEGSWSMTTYPAACSAAHVWPHNPWHRDLKTHCMDMSFNTGEYFTWASQILASSSQQWRNLIFLGKLSFLHLLVLNMLLNLSTVFGHIVNFETFGTESSLFLHLCTACSLLESLGSTVLQWKPKNSLVD